MEFHLVRNFSCVVCGSDDSRFWRSHAGNATTTTKISSICFLSVDFIMAVWCAVSNATVFVEFQVADFNSTKTNQVNGMPEHAYSVSFLSAGFYYSPFSICECVCTNAIHVFFFAANLRLQASRETDSCTRNDIQSWRIKFDCLREMAFGLLIIIMIIPNNK